MKKSIIFSVFLALCSFLFFVSPAKATEYYLLDQWQEDASGGASVYSGYNRNQTFIPSYNVLTKIQVGMFDMNGGWIDLTVKDEVTGQIIVTSGQRMGSGNGWLDFDLVGDALGYILDTTHTHSIWLATEYYPVDPPAWGYIMGDKYPLGTMRDGSTPLSGDYTFATYGYEKDFGRGDPDIPDSEPEEPDDEEEEIPDSQPPSPEEIPSGGDAPVVTVVPDVPKKAKDVLTEDVDESVTTPELDAVVVDGAIVEVDEEGNVDVELGSEIKISGIADPGDEVSVIIDENAYTALVDESGNWYVLFSTSDFKEGSYEVFVQAKNGEGKGSEKVELLTLGISDPDEEGEIIEEKIEDISWWGRVKSFIKGNILYLSGGLFLCFVIVFFVILFLKRKKNKKDTNMIKQVNRKESIKD